MFVSGTTNTIAAKFAQQTKAAGTKNGPTTIWGALDGDDGQGEEHKFDHPFFQACVMFLGEALCLIAFCLKRWYSNRDRSLSSVGRDPKSEVSEQATTDAKQGHKHCHNKAADTATTKPQTLPQQSRKRRTDASDANKERRAFRAAYCAHTCSRW